MTTWTKPPFDKYLKNTSYVARQHRQTAYSQRDMFIF